MIGPLTQDCIAKSKKSLVCERKLALLASPKILYSYKSSLFRTTGIDLKAERFSLGVCFMPGASYVFSARFTKDLKTGKFKRTARSGSWVPRRKIKELMSVMRQKFISFTQDLKDA